MLERFCFSLRERRDFQCNTKWSVPHNQLFHYLSSLFSYNPLPCTFHLICVCLIDILWLCPARLLVWTIYKGYSHYLRLSSLDIRMVKSLTSFKSSTEISLFFLLRPSWPCYLKLYPPSLLIPEFFFPPFHPSYLSTYKTYLFEIFYCLSYLWEHKFH